MGMASACNWINLSHLHHWILKKTSARNCREQHRLGQEAWVGEGMGLWAWDVACRTKIGR